MTNASAELVEPRTKGPLREATEALAPRAWADGDRVVATSLRVEESEFAQEIAAARTEQEAGVLCQNAFELGVRVRKLGRVSAETVQLGEQVQRLDETLQRVTIASSEHILKAVHEATDTERGPIAQAVSREADKLSAAIENAFDENDKRSALSKIQVAVEETVRRIGTASSETVRSLLDAADPCSPMASLQAGIRKDVVEPVSEMLSVVREIKESIEVRVAVGVEQERGTQKGRQYEELVSERLEVFGQAAGDVVENVGDTVGAIPRIKTGDNVCTIAGPRGGHIRVVFESKDRSLSSVRIAEELEQAAENRQAQVAVGVFSSQEAAPSLLPFSRLGPGRYLAVFDKESQDDLALRVAYQTARLEALSLLQQGSRSEVDLEFVLARVAEARDALTLISRIEKGLNQAEKGLDSSRATAVALRKGLNAVLDDLEGTILEQQKGAA